MVAELAGLDEVGGREDAAEEDADAANGHVGDAQEGVAAAHDGAGGNEDGLGTLVFLGREDCSRVSQERDITGVGRHTILDFNLVLALLESSCVVALIQLAESW